MEKTFTQEEVNQIVQERLERDRRTNNNDKESLAERVKQLEAQLNDEKLNAAIRIATAKAGVKSGTADYIAFTLKQGDALTVEEDGSVNGLDEKIQKLKTSLPDLFEASKDGSKKFVVEHRLEEGNHDSDGSAELRSAFGLS